MWSRVASSSKKMDCRTEETRPQASETEEPAHGTIVKTSIVKSTLYQEILLAICSEVEAQLTNVVRATTLEEQKSMIVSAASNIKNAKTLLSSTIEELSCAAGNLEEMRKKLEIMFEISTDDSEDDSVDSLESGESDVNSHGESDTQPRK
ncbi:hypothetical protein R1flu_006709 [Riccia fluitans]|uniref:Uncharacterized protein n=1 Tax=Riccia fluitans TaxID=41844 RepID=A0ABD1YXM3_9MARC